MAELFNLKKILDCFKIPNNELSKGTGIDASLISRYLSGQRQLKASSHQADSIAEFLMQAADSSERIDWLNDQFRESGLLTDISSVFHMKDNLIAWISSDGEKTVHGNSNYEMDSEILGEEGARKFGAMAVGQEAIIAALDSVISGLEERSVLDLFLTSDRIRMLTEPAFVSFLQNRIAEKNLTLNSVICVSGTTQSLNKTISAFIKNIIDGSIRFYTFFGSAQNIADQMYIVIRGKVAAMITETPMGSANPVGTFIEDEAFVNEISQNFNATYRYSQPLFSLYNSDYTRNMIEILYTEYCLPGGLSVVKDSVNPMYMSFEDYCRVLKKNNSDDGEYAWKCNEYRRFKDGFNNMLDTGMPCREIISYRRLQAILREEKCRMAGLYFLGTGFFDLDLQGCMDILTGYIAYLEKYKNFTLLILDDLPELHNSNCWHIKANTGIALNDWNGAEPIMIHSNHSVVVQEFHHHYDAIWERGKGSQTNRAYVISVLKSVIAEMKKILSDKNTEKNT